MQDFTSETPASRRDFFRVTSTGLVAILALSVPGAPAKAMAATCESKYLADILTCEITQFNNPYGLAQCLAGAYLSFVACEVARAAQAFSSAVAQAWAWIHAHAGVILFVGLVIGLVVIIGFTAGTAAPIFALAPLVA